jgi:UDP-GlcNAc:undecaprenyl-phosphate GlcNAc-1-phosphate transferase
MIYIYLYLFLVSAGISLLITPFIRDFSQKMKVLDHAGHRKIHLTPVPLLGGIAIILAFFISQFTAIKLFPEIQQQISKPIAGMIVSVFLIIILGIFDDIFDLSSKTKIIVEIIAAIYAVSMGFKITILTNPVGRHLELGILSLPVSILWILLIMNAINLMDGLDGLASGIVIIAGTALFSVGILRGNMQVPLFSAALVGATAGFLKYNYHPASIFMGDVGSLFLGFILALISIVGSYKGTTTVTLLLPLVILVVPVMETVVTVLRRLLNKQAIFSADRNHIHHRLLELGLSHPKVVLVLYLISSSFGFMGIGFSLGNKKFLLIFSLFYLILGSWIVYRILFARWGRMSKNEKK